MAMAVGFALSATVRAEAGGVAHALPAFVVQPSQCVHTFRSWSAGSGSEGDESLVPAVEQKSE